jgi:hypothetical protein
VCELGPATAQALPAAAVCAQIPLGHRFRALKLWFVLRMYGAEGLRALMRHRCEPSNYFLQATSLEYFISQRPTVPRP